jgi:putative iron-dependent peroxidase
MSTPQSAILAEVPSLARHLFFDIHTPAALPQSLASLRSLVNAERDVSGFGQALAGALGAKIPGLTTFPRYSGAGFDIPSTPAALWCWLRGDDRGDLLHRSRALQRAAAPALGLAAVIDAFRYQTGRDLTGYEDGTENPRGADALAAAIVSGQGAGLDGGSFAAVQQWVHDLDRFDAMASDAQDQVIGRRRIDNEELDDAPASAHVKRTAQESFDPQAFVLRRSMPWADRGRAGLVFVAFGKSFDAFAAQLKRMAGAEDGIADALFSFTRPLTGCYFWCPPAVDGKLDLSALGVPRI